MADPTQIQPQAADSSWRQNREKGWQHDIGYLLQDTVRSHRYELWENGTERSGTGWHPCSCGAWEGYWSDFEPHLADELRKILVDTQLIEGP